MLFPDNLHAFSDSRSMPLWTRTSEIHPFLHRFSQKWLRYGRFSTIFFKNKRDTPVSQSFFIKTSETHPLLICFFQKRARYTRISCFFCKTSQLVSFAFGIASWHNKPVKRAVCRPAMAAKEGKGMAKASKKHGLFV